MRNGMRTVGRGAGTGPRAGAVLMALAVALAVGFGVTERLTAGEFGVVGPRVNDPRNGGSVSESASESESESQQASASAVRLAPALASAAELSSDWDLDGSGTWTIADGRLVLSKAGVPAGSIRRPSALAVLRSAPLTDVTLEADLRSTAALPDQTPRRDLLLVVGYQSPTRFYYVHISAARDDVHNGIFLVADADRRRIDTKSDTAMLTDQAWHRVRLERQASTGRIALYVDGGAEPIMVATDTTLAAGRVGVGSFDDAGEFRAIRVRGR